MSLHTDPPPVSEVLVHSALYFVTRGFNEWLAARTSKADILFRRILDSEFWSGRTEIPYYWRFRIWSSHLSCNSELFDLHILGLALIYKRIFMLSWIFNSYDLISVAF